MTTPALTTKGQRTCAQIIEAAADLLHDRGVSATTLVDVQREARVSSSQLYHYFHDKQDLVRAVARHQADTVVASQDHWDLSSLDGLHTWRDDLLAEERKRQGRGGCPLGSLGADLAETDAVGREQVSAGFDRWSAAIRVGMDRMRERGDLPPGVDTERLALGILASLQGGLALGQVQRSAKPLAAALDNVIDLVAGLASR